MMQRWRDSFAHGPARAVADLLSGRAGVGAAFRRDVPEILFHEFPDRPEFAADREKLDDALLDWLDGMRTDYHRQVTRLDYGVYALRICEALRALQLLNLPRGIHHIREVHSAWLRWLAPLRLAPERDPALESWRLLSLRQPADTTPAPWLRLAADTRAEYLTVALVGLQRLPLADLKQNQTLMLTALLQHCASGGTPEQGAAEFKRQFAALRGRYPRGPEHWQSLLDTAIAAATSHTAPPRLTQLIELLRRNEAPRRGKPAKPVAEPTDRREKEALEAAIRNRNQATASVAQRYANIVEHELHYAQHTGDAHFFVRTLCNHGNLLLNRADLPADVLGRIGDWIEEALRWEPNNEHIWTFWADWLASQGREEHQEWVLREAVRLFPDNGPSRVELARLLIRRGEERWPEAEHWLREAVQRDADNEPSRVVLAKLLAATGRANQGSELLRQLLARAPRYSIAQIVLRQLEAGETHFHWDDADTGSEPATRKPAQAAAPIHPQHVATPVAGLLAHLRARAEAQARFTEARDGTQPAEARGRLKADANAGDALAGFYAAWLGEAVDPPPPHAWAWRVANCYRSDREADWQAVDLAFPEFFDLNQYLRWLADPAAENGQLASRLERRFDTQDAKDSLSPARRFALRTWQALSVSPGHENALAKDEIALALIQAEAEPISVT